MTAKWKSLNDYFRIIQWTLRSVRITVTIRTAHSNECWTKKKPNQSRQTPLGMPNVCMNAE